MNKKQLDNYERLEIYAGWSWLCEHHDTYGLGDTKQEALFMAGAHLFYYENITDKCDIYIKSHNKRGRKKVVKVA